MTKAYLDPTKLCSDPAVQEEYRSNENNYDIGTLRLFRGVYVTGEQFVGPLSHLWISKLNQPILFAIGDRDDVAEYVLLTFL